MVELILAPDAKLLDPFQVALREHEALDLPTYPATYHDVLSLAMHICEQDGATLGIAMRAAAQDLSFVLDVPPPITWLDVERTTTPRGGRHAAGDDLPW